MTTYARELPKGLIRIANFDEIPKFMDDEKDHEASVFDTCAQQSFNILSEWIIDDSDLSGAASIVKQMMHEFIEDGEPFQPSQDDDLLRFIAETIRREYPDLSENDLADLLSMIRDFPPISTGLEGNN